MKPFVNGNIVVCDGPKYDLPLVVLSHELVLEKLADRFGKAVLAAHPGAGRKRTAWPSPGKKVAELMWTSLKNMYDAGATPLMFIQADLITQVRLLGMTWCIQNVKTGNLTLHDGTALDRINPAPCMSFFGPWNDDRKQYDKLPEGRVDAIAEIVNGPLQHLTLDFQRTTVSTPATMKSGLTDGARIYFPHHIYGNGRGPIAVRCVSSDGGEPDPVGNVEN